LAVGGSANIERHLAGSVLARRGRHGEGLLIEPEVCIAHATRADAAVGESLRQLGEQFVRSEPLVPQVSRCPKMASRTTAMMKIATRLKPTMIPAKAKPAPPIVPFDCLMRLRATNPKMTPRMHGTPKRKGTKPTHEQTSDATAKPLVRRGWVHVVAWGIGPPNA
jgi:hypothetical protein